MEPITLLTWSFPAITVILLCFVAFIFATSESTPTVTVFDHEKVYTSDTGAPPTNFAGSIFSGTITVFVAGSKESFPSVDEEATLDLTVVVPAYNEEERLPKMLDECTKYLDQSGDKYEIIIVDDGSKDSTTATALEWSRKIGSDKLRVLTLAKNLGKGGAVRRGMLVGRGRYLLFADADGATTFSELAKLQSSMSKNENDEGHGIICGSRAHLEADSISSRSLFRTILMYGFHLCVSIFGCRSIKDTQCGFKLLTRKTARLVFKSLHIERWAFDVELLKIAELSGIAPAEVAVKWTEIDGSKLDPVLASIQMFKDLFLLWLRYAVGAWRLVEKVD
jgi:dolichyl-phosphate beta-glucosyltransferase